MYISDWILYILEWQSKNIGRFLVWFFGITEYVEEAELASKITLVFARATVLVVFIVLVTILVLIVFETIKLLGANSDQSKLLLRVGRSLGFVIVFFGANSLTKLVFRCWE
ncbi:MAG: hypothetical protein F6K17_01990 [Okeania sp. SIO3C4]|nr:hypothetical protein [Okeania sp. SIO3C4]